MASNPSDGEALLRMTRETFNFLCDLIESGNIAAYGLESSQERANKLLHHALTESLNILRLEDETLSIETLGGLEAVKKLVRLGHEVAALPEHLRVKLDLTLGQHLRQKSGHGRAAKLKPKG